MNTITITGNLGRDAELRFTSAGKAVVNFSVADEERRKNLAGEWETVQTTWWNCSLWDAKAEAAAEVLAKGTRVIVTGRAMLRKYEARDGGQGQSLDVKVQDVAVVPKPDRPNGDGWAAKPSSVAADEQPPF